MDNACKDCIHDKVCGCRTHEDKICSSFEHTRIDGEWLLSNVACEPQCSNCGEFALELGFEKEQSAYCPHCGAKMKKSGD